jgi:toxin ParE1/3/4
MSGKPVIPRDLALADARSAVDYYLKEAGEATALSFVDALESAYDHLSRYPATSSFRYAHALDLPELRFWPLKRFPYLVFYVDRPDHVDVWRVLHGERNIPAWLNEADPAS